MNDLLKIAIKAAIQAGHEIIEVYRTDFRHELKEDLSPITMADRKANTVINSFLEQTNIPIISEENAETPYNIRKYWDTCWIVDPLDGTKEFIKRNDEFTVNIALVKNGQPILGVVYVPVQKLVYAADVDKKQWYRSVIESTITDAFLDSLKPAERNFNCSDKLRVVASRSHLNEQTAVFIESLKKENEVELISKGSSLKFCLLAEGLADIYPRFAPTMEWDTAAAQAICNAAGVNVLSLDTDQSMSYNKEDLHNSWFICK